MARDLKRINAYPDFRTTAGIDGVRTAVLAGVPPAGVVPVGGFTTTSVSVEIPALIVILSW